MFKKWKLRILLGSLLLASSAAAILYSTSCSYTRPQMQIDGNGGTLFDDTKYIYSLTWKGMYDSRMQLDNFKVEYFNDDNGQVGLLNSQYEKYFKDWHSTNDNNSIQKRHEFVLLTNSNVSSNPPINKFWVRIRYYLNNRLETETFKAFTPPSNQNIVLDMDVNDQSDPTKFCEPLEPNDKTYDGYAIMLNSELKGDDGYIFEEGSTVQQAQLVYNRWCADIVYEIQDAVHLVQTSWSLPVSIESWNGHISLQFNLLNGEVDELKVALHVKAKAAYVFPMNIDINVETFGSYVLNGVFSFHPWEEQYFQKNVEGNYLSFAPRDVGTMETFGSHYHVTATNDSTLFPVKLDHTYFTSEGHLMGSNPECTSIFIKSYYLSKFSQVDKVKIKQLSSNPEYYEEYDHENYAPRIDQPNLQIPYGDSVIDYTDQGIFRWYPYNYYIYSDQNLVNFWEPYVDDTFIIHNNKDDGTDPYLLTMIYGEDEKEKDIPWFQVIERGYFLDKIYNEVIPDWNDKPFLYWVLNLVYSTIEGPNDPKQLPDPTGDKDAILPPSFYCFAFPPGVIDDRFHPYIPE